MFILAGATAIDRFSATFNVFGAFLIFTAVQPVRHLGVQPDIARDPVLRLAASRRTRRQDTNGPASGIQPPAQPVP
ncbi:hypothetical protein AB0J35_31940 [Nonomuraea angiospora]|uniref:hypothetical protein n=1 Tax=Nonomuraea angiospora TaxID=46172 RepID=UPI0034379E95